MRKIIIEVGSTVTKVDLYENDNVTRLKDVTILLKKHYKELGKIAENDFYKLCDLITELKKEYTDFYVCGTSIFRDLNEEERKSFLDTFKKETGLEFIIISQDEESRLTALGATRKVNSKVAVMIGGGGSTEIAIYDEKIVDNKNTSIGVMDILEVFPDLKDDIATTKLEEVVSYIKERLNIPNDSVETLVLAGGAHEMFARKANFTFETNELYLDKASPIIMDIDTRIKDTRKYFEETSLNQIKENSNDPAWWDATRAMCAFALVVAESLNVKHIVPTDISMVYGIIESLKK